MRSLGFIAGILFSPGLAYASCGYIDMPPSQFYYAPKTAVHLDFRDYDKVDKACRSVLRVRVGGREEACGGYHWGLWWVNLPRTGDSDAKVRLMSGSVGSPGIPGDQVARRINGSGTLETMADVMLVRSAPEHIDRL